MKLIHTICVILLIKFAASSSDQDVDGPCIEEYWKQKACFDKTPRVKLMFDELNTTIYSPTYTGSEDDLNVIRSITNRHCEAGNNYLHCVENSIISPECQNYENRFAELFFVINLYKFVIEYVCQNDAEVMIKIDANDGLKSLIKIETAVAFDECLSVMRPHTEPNSYIPLSESFCKHSGVISDCLVEYTNKMPNQDISETVRDVFTQLKVMFKCAATD